MEKAKKALKVVLAVFLSVYLIGAIGYSVMMRFGTLKNGEEPTIFGYTFRSVGAEADKKLRFSGDVIVTKTLSQDEAVALNEGDIVVYMQPGQSTVVAPLMLGEIRKAYGYQDGAVAYSIAENGRESAETIPALMVKEQWTGKVLHGIAGFHRFFWSQTGFLLIVVIPVILITGGMFLLALKRPAKDETERSGAA